MIKIVWRTYIDRYLIVNEELLIVFQKEQKKPVKQFFRGEDNTLKALHPTVFIKDGICDKFFSQMDKEQFINVIMDVQNRSILQARFLEWGITKIPECSKGKVAKQVQPTWVKVNPQKSKTKSV